MKKLLEKEFRAYLIVIMILLVVNISFFFVVARTSTCYPYNMASQCLEQCGSSWALQDNLFYCECACVTEIPDAVM